MRSVQKGVVPKVLKAERASWEGGYPGVSSLKVVSKTQKVAAQLPTSVLHYETTAHVVAPPPLAHAVTSLRVGSLPNTTAGSGGVGVRSAGGRMTKHSAKASTVDRPSKKMRAATALSAMHTPSVALGSCHDSSACVVVGDGERCGGGALQRA